MIMNMAYGGGAAASGKLLSTLNVGDTLEVPVVPDAQPRFGMHIVWKVADKTTPDTRPFGDADHG